MAGTRGQLGRRRLPAIVVGVVAVGFAALHGNGFGFGSGRPRTVSTSSSSSAAAGCLGRVLQGIRSSRKTTLPVGSKAVPVFRAGPPDGRVGLRLTNAGRTVGGLVFSYLETSQLFTVSKVVDADCKPVADLRDITQPCQNPHELINWDYRQMRLGSKLYDLQLGNQPPLEATFTGVTS